MSMHRSRSADELARPSKTRKLSEIDDSRGAETCGEEQIKTTGRTASGGILGSIKCESSGMGRGRGSDSHESLETATAADHGRLAMSEALKIPELVSEILSFLSGPDLIASIQVSKIFYNCAMQSRAVQSELFMTSSRPATQFYMIQSTQLFMGEDENEHETQQWRGLSPTAGLRHDAMNERQISRPCRVVRICPWFQVRTIDLAGNQARSRSSALFIASPALALGHPDVFITDPPVPHTTVHLCYRHTVDPSIVVFATRIIRQVSGVTLIALMRNTWTAKGYVWLEQPGSFQQSSLEGWSDDPITMPCITETADETIAAFTERYVREMGGSFALDFERSYVRVHRTIIPEEDWVRMCKMLVKDKKQKKLIGDEEYAAWAATISR